MKRLVIVPIALLALGSLATAEAARRTSGPQAEPQAAQLRVVICHRTSGRNPYRRIVVSTRAALRGHQRHAGDIIPAPGGRCPRVPLTPTTGGTVLIAFLAGANERPNPGDVDGSGTATFRLIRGAGQLCFQLTAAAITLPAAGAHIHTGTATEAGDIVVPLVAPGAGGSSQGCRNAARSLVAQILDNPAGFYANVHTTDFPGGAIRGQLEARAAGTRYLGAVMTGAAERPKAGDPDGLGSAFFRIRGTDISYTLVVRNLDLPAAGAHIHRGGADVAGPVIIPLQAPDASGITNASTTADAALLNEILQTPAGFYANVHTAPNFPGGAVRGQLSAMF